MKYRSQLQPAGLRWSQNSRGFTLVEILIVVVILGILAAIIVPQMSGASQAARESTLKDITRYLRSQIVTYKAQHRDTAPGHPGGNASAAATEAAFYAQMTQFTDDNGNVSAVETATHKYGPYLSKAPANPMSNLSTITIISSGDDIPAVADGLTGWYYKPSTQEIVPNTPGTDTAGVPFTSY